MPTADQPIRTTHIGSLPRPTELVEFFERAQQGEDIDETRFQEVVADATQRVVERQADIGLDVINNGEQPRIAFNFYAVNRLTNYDGETTASFWGDLDDFPDYADLAFDTVDVDLRTRPAATGPIEYVGHDTVRAEIAGFQSALETIDTDGIETFFTAVAPGTVATSLGNDYYDTYEEYVFAIADAFAEEYTIIAEETDGAIQLDAPDLLAEAHRVLRDLSDAEFLDVVRTHIEALNRSLDGIDAERVRLHTCWGNYEGPHTHDIALQSVLPELYDANVGALSIEQANPRHQHEFRALEETPIPEGWTFIPGVIDTKTNIVEPPEVIADRLEGFVDIIGDPSRVIGAPDCGFGTLAGLRTVDSEIAWAKLESLVEGARLANDRVGASEPTGPRVR